MHTTNRLTCLKADYLLLIVERPSDWQPCSLESVPQELKVLAVNHVASFAEAHDDLRRINQHSLQHHLRQWAVIQSGGGDL